MAPAPNFSATLQGMPSGRAGAFHTISKMRALVQDAVTDPQILNFAVSVIFIEPQHDYRSELEAIFNFVRGSIRYVRDIVGIETLADPRMTILRRVGDCDDKATLLATLFEAVGYPTRFVLAGYASSVFEHVYLQVFLEGEWINADATVYQPLGYAPPNPVNVWFERV